MTGSPQVAQTTLPPNPVSVGQARAFVARTLVGRGLGDTDLAELLVSELVTNVVLHAGTDVELRVAASGDQVRVEVSDTSPAMPAIRHFDVEAGTGRGMMLVEALASDWGTDPRPGGKTVWFTLTDPVAV